MRGYRVAPGEEVELIFVVEVQQTGMWHWPETQVFYRVDDQKYMDSTLTGFRVCPVDRGGC